MDVDDPAPDPDEPEGGAVVAVEPPLPVAAVVAVVPVESLDPVESVVPLVAVVELPEPPLAPDPELDIVEDVAPIDDVVVVALAGPFAPAGVDGSAARTGEMATSPTTPAANGKRNRRCMPAS